MKKLISVLLLLSFTLSMVSCGEGTLKKEEITVYHATDMHYLSQQLTENSPAFVEMIQNGDGKMVHCIDYIMDAFVADTVKNKPDYVLVSGDLTFNGEKLSHIDLAEKFRQIEKSGTQVLVIPGNHDVDYPFCYGYGQTQFYPTDRMTDEDFEKVYADFGLKQAYTRDENSFSYMYRLTDKITLIALDTNRGNGTGIIAMETLSWLEKELEKADEGTVFIGMTHQNLLSHFDEKSFTNNYTILNNSPMKKLFAEYGVKLNLSGHIHTQHIYSEDEITEIATESMAVLPCNYGVLTVNSDSISYSTQQTDVEGWAKNNGTDNENILNFNNYAKDFYMRSQSALGMSALEEAALSQYEKKLMADFFAELNIYYFSGTVVKYYNYLVETEGYKKWLEKGSGLWHYQYITDRVAEGEKGISHNSLTISID